MDAVKLDCEPTPDISICANCGWKGNVSECELDQDGDWETGYYIIHLCPVCEDGGCVDDYTMSEKQEILWNDWFKRQKL